MPLLRAPVSVFDRMGSSALWPGLRNPAKGGEKTPGSTGWPE